MSEMIERAAQAICRAHNSHFNDEQFADLLERLKRPTLNPSGPIWNGWLAEARVAIEAMREPTQAMVEAAHDAGCTGDDGRPEQARPEIEWAAMIDEILSPRPPARTVSVEEFMRSRSREPRRTVR